MNKISIIVPIYNTKEKYLDVCMNSLLNQTYDNYEILLIDDGSLDWCKKIYKKYLSNERIKLIEQENSGVSVARNNGIKKANGKWIMFVDSDDILEHDALEKFAQRIDQNPDTDVVIAKTNTIRNGKTTPFNGYYTSDRVIVNKDDKEEVLYATITNKGKYSFIQTPWAKVYNRKFLIDNNLFFNKNVKLYEDSLYLYEVYSKASKIVYMNEIVYNYVINMDSVCNSINPNIVKNTTDCINEFKKLLKREDILYLEDEFNFFGFWCICKMLVYYFCNKNNKKSFWTLRKEYFKVVSSSPYKEFIKNVKYKDLSLYMKVFYILTRLRLYGLIKLIFIITKK